MLIKNKPGMRYNYYLHLENLTTKLSNLISDTKAEYHSKLAAKLVILVPVPKHTGQF